MAERGSRATQGAQNTKLTAEGGPEDAVADAHVQRVEQGRVASQAPHCRAQPDAREACMADRCGWLVGLGALRCVRLFAFIHIDAPARLSDII